MNAATTSVARRDVIEDACIVLRAHGINAHEQGGDVVIYAARYGDWTPVTILDVSGTVEEIVRQVARAVAVLVVGPHTHEVV